MRFLNLLGNSSSEALFWLEPAVRDTLCGTKMPSRGTTISLRQPLAILTLCDFDLIGLRRQNFKVVKSVTISTYGTTNDRFRHGWLLL